MVHRTFAWLCFSASEKFAKQRIHAQRYESAGPDLNWYCIVQTLEMETRIKIHFCANSCLQNARTGTKLHCTQVLRKCRHESGKFLLACVQLCTKASLVCNEKWQKWHAGKHLVESMFSFKSSLESLMNTWRSQVGITSGVTGTALFFNKNLSLLEDLPHK